MKSFVFHFCQSFTALSPFLLLLSSEISPLTVCFNKKKRELLRSLHHPLRGWNNAVARKSWGVSCCKIHEPWSFKIRRRSNFEILDNWPWIFSHQCVFQLSWRESSQRFFFSNNAIGVLWFSLYTFIVDFGFIFPTICFDNHLQPTMSTPSC